MCSYEAHVASTATLEIQRRVLGTEHPDTLSSMSNLASVYFYQGKFAEAEALHRQTMNRRRVLSPTILAR